MRRTAIHRVTSQSIAATHNTPVRSGQDMFNRLLAGLIILLCIALTSCASSTPEEKPIRGHFTHSVLVNPPGGSLMLTANTYAGDALGTILQNRLGSGNGILVATMVDMEDMETSSAFGRTSMQQISSRLGQYGYKMVESRLGSELRMEKHEGEFILTRDTLRLLAREHDAHGVLVGVYSVSNDKIFVSTRVVRLDDGAILGAYEYYLPMTGDTQALLGMKDSGAPWAWQRYAPREQAIQKKK